jgi:hypothetical protein
MVTSLKQARLEARWHVHDAQIPTGSIEHVPAGRSEIVYEVVQLDLFVGSTVVKVPGDVATRSHHKS